MKPFHFCQLASIGAMGTLCSIAMLQGHDVFSRGMALGFIVSGTLHALGYVLTTKVA